MSPNTMKKMLAEYEKVQKLAPAVTAQVSDDTWSEIERLSQLREQQAKKLVAARPEPRDY